LVYDNNLGQRYEKKHFIDSQIKNFDSQFMICESFFLTSEENLLVAEGADGGAVGDEQHGLLRVGRKEAVV